MRRFLLPTIVAAAAVIGVGAFALAQNSIGTTNLSAATSGSSGANAPSGAGSGAAPGAGAAQCLRHRAGSNGGASAASGASSADPAAGARGCRAELRRALMRRTVHADLVVKGKNNSWVTIDIDRGSVTTVSSSSITLERPDGVSVTAPVSSTTRFRGIPESQIKAGDRAIVVQKDHSAVIVFTRGPGSAGSPQGGGTGSGAGAGAGATGLIGA